MLEKLKKYLRSRISGYIINSIPSGKKYDELKFDANRISLITRWQC